MALRPRLSPASRSRTTVTAGPVRAQYLGAATATGRVLQGVPKQSSWPRAGAGPQLPELVQSSAIGHVAGGHAAAVGLARLHAPEGEPTSDLERAGTAGPPKPWRMSPAPCWRRSPAARIVGSPAIGHVAGGHAAGTGEAPIHLRKARPPAHPTGLVCRESQTRRRPLGPALVPRPFGRRRSRPSNRPRGQGSARRCECYPRSRSRRLAGRPPGPAGCYREDHPRGSRRSLAPCWPHGRPGRRVAAHSSATLSVVTPQVCSPPALTCRKRSPRARQLASAG